MTKNIKNREEKIMTHKRSLLGGSLSVFSNKFLGNKKGFSLTEVLIALGVIAVIAVLILPVITTRAQNKSFALSYDTEVKQMLNSLEGLPVSENKEDISNTMMYVESDSGSYSNNAGAYINKYMKVVKYCGDEPGDCFGGQYYEYKDNDRVEFDIKDIKGACALLKNGVSICLKPQIKNASGTEEIQGWIDLNGPKGPNIYGRDLRTFAINLKQKAVFTEEEPTRVIVPDPPAPCEGEDCGEIEKDPCKVNPRGEECCKREGFVASGKEDICCPWYRDSSTGANHLICYPGTAPCDPAKDPNCKIDECTNHAITGPGDECCAVIEAQGKHDPNCCAPDSVSDYCCSVHPETEGCCRKNIQSGKLQLTADSNCCTKYPTIYAEFSACKPACEQNNNSEQCCNTVSRRNEIREPDDACCMYEAVNGIDAQGENNAYNKYCCRLPKNNSDQCCKWKYEHINSSLDYYTKHDYNVNGGTFDGCCHGNIRGIKYTENKTDAKSIAVLNRCCTVNQAQSDKKEDELCCDYLVGQLGAVKLQHGQALRRCCQYDKHKNKPQCCSHQTDGMASQTYPASPVVNWAAQCCMPNSIYNNNVDPHIQCCFAVPNALGESNAFWNNKRWDGCCAHGDNNYNGHKANTEGQWQKNCCKLTRAKYPSDATYNAACCLSNAPSKGANRDSWQYFSATKNECCETLDRQYTSGSQHRDDNWQSHCCYGFKGGNLSTNNPYYETESKCCKITGNWTEGCCTKSGLNTNDDKWKKNCCNMPTQYSSNVEYRKYCCFDSNTSNHKANSTDKDYTRNSDNADNPNSKNAANVNNSNNRQYCCDPDMADHPSITDNNNRFTWNSSNTPKKECCDYFAGRDWKNNDGGSLSKYYKAACCQAYGHKDGLNCEELWMCGGRYGYGVTPSKLSSDIANGCCLNWSLIKANEDLPTSAWKNGCCDNPAYYQSHVSGKNAAYRQFCCAGASSDRQRRGEGNTSVNFEYCCFPDSTNPNVECCKMFRSKGSSNAWKDWDGNTLSNDYMTYCCNKSTAAGSNSANNYCPDSCAIRWNTPESMSNINYDFSRCCTDRALATNKSPVNSSTAVNRTKAIWKNNCCAYSPVNPAGNNIAGYASYTDYRSGCCNASQDQTFKSGNGGSSQNNINCCIPNQTTVNTSNGAVSGIVPTKACCEAFKAYDTGKTGAWKSHDKETINDAYKTACCKLHGVCPDGPDACRIRSNTWNTSMYNLPTCCKDSTMQSQHYKDSDQVWRKACCDGNITSGTSSLNTLGLADYRNYCCSSAGTSEATLKSGNEDYRCCANAAETTRLATQKCCNAAKAAGYTNNFGGRTFRDRCCQLSGQTGKTYCDCEEQYRLRFSDYFKSSTACCADQKAKRGEANWNSVCCTSANPGGLSRDEFRNASCCSNSSTGLARVGGGYITHCCDGSTVTTASDHYCCKYYNANQCACVNSQDGSAYNGNWFTRCCNGSTITTAGSHYCCKYKSSAQCACVNSQDGSAYNGNWFTRCCNGSTVTSANNNYCCNYYSTNQCTCAARASKSSSVWNLPSCCLDSTMMSNNWNTSTWKNACCKNGNINSLSGSIRQACCAKIRGTSEQGQLFAGSGSTCCQSLSGRDDGYSSYLGTYMDECKAPCYKSGTYSTGIYSSYKYTTNSAAYCCNNSYGLVSGGSGNSTWKSYCCRTYYGSSWNFTPGSYGCCDYVKSNGVWWYNPSYYGGSCSFGGEKNKCADYYYSSAGFTCGSSDSCKAWRFQGGSQPTLSSCCSSLYSWGYLSGSYKTTCCGDSTFRKSSTGQSVCCSSEPSDSTLKNNCCSDNSSRSYCCGSSSSPNYYKYSCCYARLGSKCANYASGRGSLTDAEKKDCCKCCKGDPTWGNSFNGGFCNNSSYCPDCGSGPSSSKISEACCKEWEDAGVLTSNKTIADKCCADYSGFYHYKYNGSSVYCKSSCTSTNCKGTLTWNVSCSRNGGSSQYAAKWTTNSTSNMCIGHNLLYIDIWPGQCLVYGGQPPLQKKSGNGNGSCSASYTDWQRDNHNSSIACGCKVYFYVMNKTNSNGEWYWEKISESCSGSYSYNMTLGNSCTTTHK